MQLYKMTDAEALAVGKFLRLLCQLGKIDEAKRMASMSDAQLHLLVMTDSLWDAAFRIQGDSNE